MPMKNEQEAKKDGEGLRTYLGRCGRDVGRIWIGIVTGTVAWKRENGLSEDLRNFG